MSGSSKQTQNKKAPTKEASKFSFYTPSEIQELLRIKNKDTIYLMCRSGEIPGAFRIGRHWRIEVSIFDKWLTAKVNGKY